MKIDLKRMNANQLRAYAVSLGADRKRLYGTSNDVMRMIIRELEKNGRA